MRARPRPRRKAGRSRVGRLTSAAAVVDRAILAAADSARMQRLVRTHGMKLGAGRFVAGETLDECVRVLRQLDEKGFRTNTTLLGEAVRDEAEVASVVSAYHEIISRLASERLRANVALKLTHLGLELGEELAYKNARRLVKHAEQMGNFLRIDMQQSRFVDATLRVYRRVLESGLTQVGAVLQACLRRSEDDLSELLPLRPNLRIVKGAYLEPADVAYSRKADVDAAFARLVERSLAGPGYTAIATHDARLIDHAIAFAAGRGKPRDEFEFQMLYGIQPALQAELLGRGSTFSSRRRTGRTGTPT